jgi:hypothetical protein
MTTTMQTQTDDIAFNNLCADFKQLCLEQTAWRTHNMGLFQAGLTQELQPLSLTITFGAWRQVVASKPRLQQALKRYVPF